MTDDSTHNRDDAVLTALALLEQHRAGEVDHVLTLLGDMDHLQTIRTLSTAISIARILAEDLAEQMHVPLSDILTATRKTFAPYDIPEGN